MALTNNIITGPADINLAGYKGQTVPGELHEWKFTAVLADIVALGAFLTGDIVLFNLPAGAIPLYGYLKHTTSVAGPSISACSAQIQVQGGNLTSSAFDVFQAVATTAFDFGIATTAVAKPTDVTLVNPVRLHLIAVGANLSVATAGQINCVVGYRVMAV